MASAEDLNFPLFQAKISGRGVGIKFIATGYDPPVEILEELLAVLRYVPGRESVAARPVPRPFDAPIQRTDHTIVVYRREPGFPVMHPLHVA